MRAAHVVTCLCAGLLACACDRSADSTKSDSADAGWAVHRITDAGTGSDAGCDTAACSNANELDLLFIVDNSSSMREEQAALRRAFPRMLQQLVSGDHDGDGKVEHAPITDLHVGVLSSNMGADPRVRGCDALGDDGLLQRDANLAHDGTLHCDTSYPSFLGYARGTPALERVARDFSCIEALGTAGCGFEQHLESGLKALWPASQSELSFYGASGAPTTGHGDRENAGFLRATAHDRATLGIVVVADQDDCSAADRAIFQPDMDADSGSPYFQQPLNLRCYYNHDKAFPIERYGFGFQHLGSRRVLFAGIVGVPEELVDAAARGKVDFADDHARDAFYDGLLADPHMQETLDPQSTVDGKPIELTSACSSAFGHAYPARRFVALAKRFGQDSLIQSICAGDLADPLDQVVERLTVRLN